MVTFSIIIPVYNAALTIRRCVESIENNTFKDLELILIDDGSKDSSAQVCMQLAEEFDNIKVLVNNKNRGVSYTRNRGLTETSGTYIMFADSDDWLEIDYYETFNRFIKQFDNALYICGFVNHDEKYNKRSDKYLWNKESDNLQEVDIVDFRSSLHLIYNQTLLQQLWNKAFLASIIKNNNIRFDESISIGEDFRFILEYLKKAELDKVVIINSALYHYMRDQEGSLMYHVGYESVDESLNNLKDLYELEGLADDEIAKKIAIDRQHQIELYAYLIMHNAGMNLKEKKRLILALDKEQGSKLFRHNRSVYIKEKMIQIIHR